MEEMAVSLITLLEENYQGVLEEKYRFTVDEKE